MSSLNCEQAQSFVDEQWDSTIIPTLSDFIRIPNQSPDFDAEWRTNGFTDQAVDLLKTWVEAQNVAGLSLEVIQENDMTPLMMLTVDATEDGCMNTVLMYGHLDKQPPLDGLWEEGLGPYTPVLKDGKLYGRGGADDGYALFAAITSIRALQAQGVPHARIVILIEADEESGSGDLPVYVDLLADRIGTPDLVVCLDSGSGDLHRLWITSSLRGVVNVEMRVDILNEGCHSGAASGVVPDSFRIARMLLNRIENVETGEVLGDAFYGEVPQERIEQARLAGALLGASIFDEYSFVDGASSVGQDPVEMYLAKTWRPTLTVTGADGLPPSANAGNVLRSHTTLKVSMRLAPTADAHAAKAYLKETLEANPPYGAKVTVSGDHGASGWNAPAEAPWLQEALNSASQKFYGNDVSYMGEGGSIPFMGLLNQKFPEAMFAVLGVLSPGTNAHGPNECFHIDYAKKLNASVAFILAAHHDHIKAAQQQ